MKYIKISKYLIERDNEKLIKVSDSNIDDIVKKYQNIDRDFLIFIKEVGVGNIDNRLDLKGDLFDFFDLGLEDIYLVSESVKFFGDNFSGDFIGFDFTDSNQVVEFWHDSQELFYTGKTFYEYIHDLIIV